MQFEAHALLHQEQCNESEKLKKLQRNGWPQAIHSFGESVVAAQEVVQSCRTAAGLGLLPISEILRPEWHFSPSRGVGLSKLGGGPPAS